MSKTTDFLAQGHDPRDPNPWLAVYLDRSIPISEEVKLAWLQDASSWSRQFFLPVARPMARIMIVLIQVLKIFIPNGFTSSKVLHRLLSWSLKTFVSPTANWLILRHFHAGSEILSFLGSNVPGVTIPPLNDMRLTSLEQIKDDAFLKHDLNVFNFVIYLNQQLREQGRELGPVERVNFDAVAPIPLKMSDFPNRWTNFIDLQTAIELYTPIYQLFLTDNDFWRATNSLQLDETIALYAARVLNDPTPVLLVNNRHPMISLSTLRAGYRLVLHGLATEMLHAFLLQKKQHQVTTDAQAAVA